MAPQNGVLDNFNRSDGALGANWTAFAGFEKGDVNTNQVRAGGTSDMRSYWNPITATAADCEAFMTFATLGGGTPQMGVFLRAVDSGGVDAYIAYWDSGS